MPIVRTPLVDDDGSGTTGTVINNAWQSGLYDAIDAAIAAGIGSIPPPVTTSRTVIPYSAGLYSAGGTMTWTVDAGDQIQLEYTKIGNLIWVFYNIFATVLGGTAHGDVKITLPGVTFTSQVSNAAQLTNTTKLPGYAVAIPGGGIVTIRKVDETAYTLGNLSLHGQLCAPVSAAAALDESWIKSFDPPGGGTYPEGAAAL